MTYACQEGGSGIPVERSIGHPEAQSASHHAPCGIEATVIGVFSRYSCLSGLITTSPVSSFVLKKRIKTEREWMEVPIHDVHDTTVTIGSQTYDRVTMTDGTPRATQKTLGGTRAKAGHLWVDYVRRRYLVVSLIEAIWNPETHRQRQYHRAQVLNINAAYPDNPLHMNAIESKRIAAHRAIDAHVADLRKAKVMHQTIERLLPHYTPKQFSRAREEFVECRVGVYRSRGHGGAYALRQAEKDAGRYD